MLGLLIPFPTGPHSSLSKKDLILSFKYAAAHAQNSRMWGGSGADMSLLCKVTFTCHDTELSLFSVLLELCLHH